MYKEKINKDLKDEFGPDSDIKIFTDDDKYFNTIVISDLFKDKTLLERQKLVYEVIGKYIVNKEVHAFSFKTYTKTEWSEVN